MFITISGFVLFTWFGILCAVENQAATEAELERARNFPPTRVVDPFVFDEEDYSYEKNNEQ